MMPKKATATVKEEEKPAFKMPPLGEEARKEPDPFAMIDHLFDPVSK